MRAHWNKYITIRDICIHACVYACPYAYEFLSGRPSRSFNEHADSVVRAKWRTDVLLRRFSPPLRNGRRSSAKKRKIEGKNSRSYFLGKEVRGVGRLTWRALVCVGKAAQRSFMLLISALAGAGWREGAMTLAKHSRRWEPLWCYGGQPSRVRWSILKSSRG